MILKILVHIKYKPIVYALKNYNLNSREKFEPGPGFEPSEVQIPVQVWNFQLNLFIYSFVSGTLSSFDNYELSWWLIR